MDIDSDIDEIVSGGLTRKSIHSYEERKNEGKTVQNNLYPKMGGNDQKVVENTSDGCQKIKRLEERITSLISELTNAQSDYKQVLKERNEAQTKWQFAAYSIARLETQIKELRILREKENKDHLEQVNYIMDANEKFQNRLLEYEHARKMMETHCQELENKCKFKMREMVAQVSKAEKAWKEALDLAKRESQERESAHLKEMGKINEEKETILKERNIIERKYYLVLEEINDLRKQISHMSQQVSKDSRDGDDQLKSNIQKQSICTPIPKMSTIENEAIHPTIENIQTKPTVKLLISKEENCPSGIYQSMNSEKQAKSTVKASQLKSERRLNGTDFSLNEDSTKASINGTDFSKITESTKASINGTDFSKIKESTKASNLRNSNAICSSQEKRQVKSSAQDLKTLPVRNMFHMNLMKRDNSKLLCHTLGMFLGLIIGVIVIPFVSIMMNKPANGISQDVRLQNSGQMRYPLVKNLDFNSIISNLSSSFNGQPEMSFKVVRSALKSVFVPEPQAPAIILLLASKGAEKLALDLGNALVTSVSSSPIAISGKNYQTQRIDIGKKSLDETLRVMDATADSRFNAVLIEDLHLIPGETALTLHTYCDSDHAPYKHVVYVLIVNMDEELKQTRKEWDIAAFKRLEEAWDKVDLDQKDPLLSRLTVSVAAVFKNKS